MGPTRGWDQVVLTQSLKKFPEEREESPVWGAAVPDAAAAKAVEVLVLQLDSTASQRCPCRVVGALVHRCPVVADQGRRDCN